MLFVAENTLFSLVENEFQMFKTAIAYILGTLAMIYHHLLIWYENLFASLFMQWPDAKRLSFRAVFLATWWMEVQQSFSS